MIPNKGSFREGQTWLLNGWPYFVQYRSDGTFLIPADTHAFDFKIFESNGDYVLKLWPNDNLKLAYSPPWGLA